MRMAKQRKGQEKKSMGRGRLLAPRCYASTVTTVVIATDLQNSVFHLSESSASTFFFSLLRYNILCSILSVLFINFHSLLVLTEVFVWGLFLANSFFLIRLIFRLCFLFREPHFIFINERLLFCHSETKCACVSKMNTSHSRGVMLCVIGNRHSIPKLFAFRIALIPLGKICIQLFCLQLWTDGAL